jgi:serine O-acetyltransferase
MVNISNIEQFEADLKKILALEGGKILPQTWKTFFNTYCGNKLHDELMQQIREDLDFFKENDPASVLYSWDQILSTRRGMIAIVAHRIFRKILSFQPELIFEVEVLAKSIQSVTNVEIHPQAKFGKRFAIDHGHGTVVGATTIAGNNIFIYHGVTLGATGNISMSHRRHPKMGNNIFLGNGSQILGPSVLENDIRISSEAMILDSYIESDVTISPSVLVSKVRIPRGYHVFGFDSKLRKYVARCSEKKETELIAFERVNIRDFD